MLIERGVQHANMAAVNAMELVPNIWVRLIRLLLALACLAPAVALAQYAEILRQFETIRTRTVWPVRGGSPDDIEETFGPRRQPSNQGAYDWHRGIDIDHASGRIVVAALDGEFSRYTEFASGGWTVILRHPFPEPIQHEGKTLSYFYTFHMHLEDALTPAFIKEAQANGTRPAVKAGDQIAHMGNSGQGPGGAYAVHLHFELRVGTQNSLENQLANFTPGSASYYGFDPHFHPLLLFPPGRSDILIEPVGAPSPEGEEQFLITLGDDDWPILNQARVDLCALETGAVLKSHTLDLNRRIGFDPSNTPSLDARDFTKPYFAPLYFVDAQTNYQTQLVVPAAFKQSVGGTPAMVRVVVRDIWGKSVQFPTPRVGWLANPAQAPLVFWPAHAANLRPVWSPAAQAPGPWALLPGSPELRPGSQPGYSLPMPPGGDMLYLRLREDPFSP